MTTTVKPSEKQLCRLCYYETTDTIEIFSPKGVELDYVGKINKYLYLQVVVDDIQPKTICWMCSQHLETFHKFYEKINEIQLSMLKEKYENVVLRPNYHKKNDVKFNIQYEEDYIFDNTSDNTVQVLLIHPETSETYNNDGVNDANTITNDQENIDTVVDNIYSNTIDDNAQQRPASPVKDDEHNMVIFEVSENGKAPVPIAEFKEPQTKDETNCRTTRSRGLFLTALAALEKNEKQKQKKRKKDVEKSVDDVSETESTDNEYENDIDFQLVDIKQECSVDEDFVEDVSQENALTQYKRKRGRPKGARNKSTKSNDDEDTGEPIKAGLKSKNRNRSIGRKKNGSDGCMHDIEEGESDNEFPARDSDNEDWPAQSTLDTFPKQILSDGLLLVKGKKLMDMICKFYKLECEMCSSNKPRYKHLKELFAHYTETHKEEGYVTCCQTKLSRYPAIIMHMARHLQPDAFKCDICGYMVTRPRFLESHKQTHLPEDQKPFACDQCPRRFCWKGALQIHMISHQPAAERKLYICHVCGKIYDTPGGLSTHKKLIHGDKQTGSNVCHVCAKKFATRTGLNEHMATIHQPREKDQQQCTECGKWLMNQRCLKSHMILHSDAVFHCHVCDYTTKKQILLRRHFLTQHSEEKPFSCEICGKTFKLKRALTVHLSQHNNKKSFKCTFCDRVFNSSTNFYTHRKNLHPLELQAMRDRAQELQRQKRIKAGVEEGKLLQQQKQTECDDDDVDDVDESEIVPINDLITITPKPMELQEQHLTIVPVKNEQRILIQTEHVINASENVIFDGNTAIITRFSPSQFQKLHSVGTNSTMIVNISDIKTDDSLQG